MSSVPTLINPSIFSSGASSPHDWYLLTTYPVSITGNRSLFTELDMTTPQPPIRTVGGETLAVQGVGTITLHFSGCHPIRIKPAYYVPIAERNIFPCKEL